MGGGEGGCARGVSSLGDEDPEVVWGASAAASGAIGADCSAAELLEGGWDMGHCVLCR
jgi:hypothetical protein